MKTQTRFSIYLILAWFLTLCACETGPYVSIQVQTAYGKEVISSSCSAWKDGCNIYCRTNTVSRFMTYARKDKCNDSDIIRAQCIDDNQYKDTLEEGWSLTETNDQCI